MFSEKLISTLRGAEHITVFTGAGISAESGVPTFRGDDGLWKKFKPEELANFDAFIRNPKLVWEWYRYRKQVLANVKPNAGHYALADMEQLHKNVVVITQNIDNLHQRAGSTKVYELHGNINRNYCIDCGLSITDEVMSWLGRAPLCPSCHGLIRPDVVWFGELLPVDQWNKSIAVAEAADVFFSVGTSAVVYPAASLPTIAKNAGAYLLEINTERTDLSWHADEILLGKSGDILPRLLQSYQSVVHQ